MKWSLPEKLTVQKKLSNISGLKRNSYFYHLDAADLDVCLTNKQLSSPMINSQSGHHSQVPALLTNRSIQQETELRGH